MPQFRPGQLVRIRHLQAYSRTSCGRFISAGQARNSGKIVQILRSEYSTYYSIVNPRTKRTYRYTYPESAFIGLTIYTRQQP